MKPIAEKRNALDRALEMLSRDNVDDLRYAALELRRCIEAVVLGLTQNLPDFPYDGIMLADFALL